jgi:hypothetical protein
MTENTASRKYDEKGAGHLKDVSEKLNAANDHATKLNETATKGIKDYNLRALEIAQINSAATFDCAKQLMSAKSQSEMLELWTMHARKQFEALTEQTKELAMLGQKVAAETAGLLSSQVTKGFNQSA